MPTTATKPRSTRAKAADEENELETWHNSVSGRVVIDRFSQTGALVAEMIGGHKNFQLTTKERRLNEERCATEEQNIFRNGICQPVTLNPAQPDTAELLANPNILNEEQQRALFELPQQQFEDRLAQITHVAVLNRLVGVAQEMDARLSQMAAVQRRIDEVAPLLATEITTAAVDDPGGRRSAPVSPR